jgi:hypothetical protein
MEASSSTPPGDTPQTETDLTVNDLITLRMNNTDLAEDRLLLPQFFRWITVDESVLTVEHKHFAGYGKMDCIVIELASSQGRRLAAAYFEVEWRDRLADVAEGSRAKIRGQIFGVERFRGVCLQECTLIGVATKPSNDGDGQSS